MDNLVHRLGQAQVFSLTTSLKLMEMEIAPVESVQQHQSGQLQAAALPGLGKLRRPKQTTLDYTSQVARETSGEFVPKWALHVFFCGAKQDQDRSSNFHLYYFYVFLWTWYHQYITCFWIPPTNFCAPQTQQPDEDQGVANARCLGPSSTLWLKNNGKTWTLSNMAIHGWKTWFPLHMIDIQYGSTIDINRFSLLMTLAQSPRKLLWSLPHSVPLQLGGGCQGFNAWHQALPPFAKQHRSWIWLQASPGLGG